MFLKPVFIILFLCVLQTFAHNAWQKRNSLIARGTLVTRGEFAHMVALVRTDSDANQFCGGSLVNSQYVVTAAHCFDSITASQVAVIADRLDLSITSGNTGVRSLVSSITKHPQWDSATLTNDVAVLKLATPIAQSQYIKYAKFETAELPLQTLVWVSGYGVTETSTTNLKLYKVQIPIAQTSMCGTSSTTIICAGDGNGHDSCSGDSGSALGRFINGTFYQAGIVSFGPSSQCGRVGDYGTC